jgi:hypothetical protein
MAECRAEILVAVRLESAAHMLPTLAQQRVLPAPMATLRVGPNGAVSADLLAGLSDHRQHGDSERQQQAIGAPRIVHVSSLDGIKTGMTIEMTLIEKEDGAQCTYHRGRVTPWAGVSFADSKEGMLSGNSPNLVRAPHSVTVGSACTGSWEMDLIALGEKPFGEVVAGEFPPVVAVRYFRTEKVEDCPGLASAEAKGNYVCADPWVATMRKN